MTSWNIDQAHTHLQFSARHMMISKVRGEFEKFSGVVNFDEENPENTTVDVQIDVSSINTREEQRDTHLRSADFFDAENYPVMNFKSKRVELIDDTHAKLVGDLTIKDVTREVVLDVEFVGKVVNPWGKEAAGFNATTTINRKDWGLNWNVALETGGWLVGEKIRIDIELELIKQTETEAAGAATA